MKYLNTEKAWQKIETIGRLVKSPSDCQLVLPSILSIYAKVSSLKSSEFRLECSSMTFSERLLTLAGRELLFIQNSDENKE